MRKIDWQIHAIPDAYNNDPMTNGLMNLHTHGLNKHGLTELSVVVDPNIYPAETVAYMINTVGRMMIEGEVFEVASEYIHYIDKPDGTNDFKFKLMPVTCYEEESLRMLLPDVNGKFYDGDEDELELWNFLIQYTTLPEIQEYSQFNK